MLPALVVKELKEFDGTKIVGKVQLPSEFLIRDNIKTLQSCGDVLVRMMGDTDAICQYTCRIGRCWTLKGNDTVTRFQIIFKNNVKLIIDCDDLESINFINETDLILFNLEHDERLLDKEAN
jgi:hypothetical protein